MVKNFLLATGLCLAAASISPVRAQQGGPQSTSITSPIHTGISSPSHTNRSSPIQWNYSVRKINEKTFEVHLTASLQSGWHAYSQTQPEEAVAQPTVIRFKPNPLVEVRGRVKEKGNLEKWQDKVKGIKANQYENKIDFIQVIKVRSMGKTNISGTLTYQVCTEELCLPPKTDAFDISLG
jgi:Disulphide bond corrector protein DsbC